MKTLGRKQQWQWAFGTVAHHLFATHLRFFVRLDQRWIINKPMLTQGRGRLGIVWRDLSECAIWYGVLGPVGDLSGSTCTTQVGPKSLRVRGKRPTPSTYGPLGRDSLWSETKGQACVRTEVYLREECGEFPGCFLGI